MSNIHFAPRRQSQAGAKLYYRASGTSTPQNVYEDINLATPHSNPVVADADGWFPVIYFDPSLPSYRIIHTDGSNVDNDPTLEVQLEDTLDDIPSSNNQAQTYLVKGTSPTIILDETDGGTNARKWRIRVNSNVMSIDTGNDAESSWVQRIKFSRGGDITVTGALYQDASPSPYAFASIEYGTFTGTLSGCTTSPTCTVSYVKVGRFVSLQIASVTGTSNSTSCVLSGIPSLLRPTSLASLVPVAEFTDNGAVVSDVSASFGISSANAQFRKAGSTTGFTNSGTKGLAEGVMLTYLL